MSRSALREKAYQALDGERAYQDNRSPDNRSLGDLILLMDVYLNKAKVAFAQREGRQEALHAVRKVAALGVLVAERHGPVFRD